MVALSGTCCVNCCGNPLLDEYIAGLISQFSISPELVETYMKIRDDAAGRTNELSDSGGSSSGRDGTYPPEQDETSTKSHASSTASNETTTEGGVGTNVDQPMNPSKQSESNYVEGSEMEVETSKKFNTGLTFSGAPMLGMILVIALMVIIYWGYRRRG